MCVDVSAVKSLDGYLNEHNTQNIAMLIMPKIFSNCNSVSKIFIINSNYANIHYMVNNLMTFAIKEWMHKNYDPF